MKEAKIYTKDLRNDDVSDEDEGLDNNTGTVCSICKCQ